MSMVLSFIEGFVASLALIIAIGAQNAFLLRQGLLKQAILPLVLFCACADALLIALGVIGLGALIEYSPIVITLVRYGGALFLLVYGGMALGRVFRPTHMDINAVPSYSLGRSLLVLTGLTFLNPHVYLDTMVLLGALANQQVGTHKWLFASGAMIASFVWFVALGYGARLLAKWFIKPLAWQVLDSLIAIIMFGLAVLLLFFY